MRPDQNIVVKPPFVFSRANHEDISRKYLDVEYAKGDAAYKLDIYMPSEGDGPFPVIAFFHGGGFLCGDKGDFQVQPFLEGVRRGYIVASIDYRLAPHAFFPEPIKDTKTAIRFLRAHADEFRIDKDKIASVGDSAGGYYAMMLAITSGIEDFEDISQGCGDFSSEVQACVCLFGVFDLGKADEELIENNFLPPRIAYGEESIDYIEWFLGWETEEQKHLLFEKSSALNYVHKEIPPILLEHGNVDQQVPYQQSVRLAEKIREVAGKDKIILKIMEGSDHLDPLFFTPENIDLIFGFLDKHLRHS